MPVKQKRQGRLLHAYQSCSRIWDTNKSGEAASGPTDLLRRQLG